MSKILVSVLLFFALFACKNSQSVPKYISVQGSIFSTWYHITYESPNGADFSADITEELNRLDYIFSTFKKESTLSKVNRNEEVVLEDHFIKVFNKAIEISELSGGAFDATVAPLVNAWGFGFTKKETVTKDMIDSIKQYVGYKMVKIENGKVVKQNPNIMIDFSAISKGFAVDAVGDLLHKKGCKNYMVEIGGEVVTRGVNKEGNAWRIGINEPNENEPAQPTSLQAIIGISNKGLATSGNYRNFYVENGKKYAHTINPSTGYPVEHSLLSATVIADDCMTADAFATAFMVMGVEAAQKLVSKLNGIEVFLIFANEDHENQVLMSDGFKAYLLNN